MDDEDLREQFAGWLRPVREAEPPGLPVIRRRLRIRRARNAAAGTVFVAAAAGIAVHLAPGASGPAGGPSAPGHNSSASYTISSPVSTLIVNGGAGQITVTGEQRSTVSVTEQMVYSARPPSMTQRLADGTLTLGYGCPDQQMCVASYDIKVPRTTTVLVTDQSGEISLSSLAGPVTVSSDLGSITATGLASATADFNSQSGPIIASFTAVPAEVDATSGTGVISIHVPGTVSYCVTTQAGPGTIDVTVPENPESPHTISATSQTGAVTIAPGG